jgi:hypothetical protein
MKQRHCEVWIDRAQARLVRPIERLAAHKIPCQ